MRLIKEVKIKEALMRKRMKDEQAAAKRIMFMNQQVVWHNGFFFFFGSRCQVFNLLSSKDR